MGREFNFRQTLCQFYSQRIDDLLLVASSAADLKQSGRLRQDRECHLVSVIPPPHDTLP
jgi:hypothetical protein